jgi:hypothetical protein
MNVNQVGIQSYQHVSRRETQQAPFDPKNTNSAVDEKLVIEPQTESATSKLAIKAPDGNYGDFLTADERKALDLLFSRFRDRAQFAGKTDVQADEAMLGRIIDVKV